MEFGANEKGSDDLLDQAGKSHENHSSGQWTGPDGTRGSLIPDSLVCPRRILAAHMAKSPKAVSCLPWTRVGGKQGTWTESVKLRPAPSLGVISVFELVFPPCPVAEEGGVTWWLLLGATEALFSMVGLHPVLMFKMCSRGSRWQGWLIQSHWKVIWQNLAKIHILNASGIPFLPKRKKVLTFTQRHEPDCSHHQ